MGKCSSRPVCDSRSPIGASNTAPPSLLGDPQNKCWKSSLRPFPGGRGRLFRKAVLFIVCVSCFFLTRRSSLRVVQFHVQLQYDLKATRRSPECAYLQKATLWKVRSPPMTFFVPSVPTVDAVLRFCGGTLCSHTSDSRGGAGVFFEPVRFSRGPGPRSG